MPLRMRFVIKYSNSSAIRGVFSLSTTCGHGLRMHFVFLVVTPSSCKQDRTYVLQDISGDLVSTAVSHSTEDNDERSFKIRQQIWKLWPLVHKAFQWLPPLNGTDSHNWSDHSTQ